MKESEHIKEIVEKYLKGDKNFIRARVTSSLIELEFQNLNENYHETLVPYLKENVDSTINFKYVENNKFLIFT